MPASTQAVAADDGHCVHVATGSPIGWRRYDGAAWQSATLPIDARGPVDLDIAGAGHVHLAARVAQPDGISIIWTLPSGDADGVRPVETALHREPGLIGPDPVYVAVAPPAEGMPEGVPHILASERGALHHTRRVAPGEWSPRIVDRAESLGEPGCAPSAEADGDTCLLHEVEVRPWGAVASGNGDVRLVWGASHRRGTLVAEWINPGAPPVWSGVADDHEVWTEIFVGAVTDAGVLTDEPFRLDGRIIGATVLLGDDGALHLALYADDANRAAYDVRYLRIGPAD